MKNVVLFLLGLLGLAVAGQARVLKQVHHDSDEYDFSSPGRVLKQVRSSCSSHSDCRRTEVCAEDPGRGSNEGTCIDLGVPVNFNPSLPSSRGLKQEPTYLARLFNGQPVNDPLDRGNELGRQDDDDDKLPAYVKDVRAARENIMSDLRVLFDLMDRDGDGILTPSELAPYRDVGVEEDDDGYTAYAVVKEVEATVSGRTAVGCKTDADCNGAPCSPAAGVCLSADSGRVRTAGREGDRYGGPNLIF